MNYSVQLFCKKVLVHYEKEGRDHLQWRKTKDPYRILVSEMMLQQTQVDRVIPYYQRFIKKFPIAKTLAQASLGTVLKEWSGLGYNRRAKFLHQAAQVIASQHHGKTPSDYIALRALPGVGEYTAKAVRTFAFDLPEVMLETNIRTAVIHDFFPRGRKVSDERLASILAACIQHVNSPRVWYWALMDYGTQIKKEHSNATRRSRAYVKQKPFKDSQRQVRGAILRTLSGSNATESTLAYKTGFATSRLMQALVALEAEGMVRKNGSRWQIS
ncbi:A/G-specific adenine glycosylase [Candidatus Kaiserbacteria bacterium]|nr:A/G-specific adenine glycosylase [Candidatus Kaiserbacteria bacterium]